MFNFVCNNMQYTYDYMRIDAYCVSSAHVHGHVNGVRKYKQLCVQYNYNALREGNRETGGKRHKTNLKESKTKTNKQKIKSKKDIPLVPKLYGRETRVVQQCAKFVLGTKLFGATPSQLLGVLNCQWRLPLVESNIKITIPNSKENMTQDPRQPRVTRTLKKMQISTSRIKYTQTQSHTHRVHANPSKENAVP